MTNSEIRELWISEKTSDPSLSTFEFAKRHNLNVSSMSNVAIHQSIRASKAKSLSDLVVSKHRRNY